MGRKRGFDSAKIGRIISLLAANPDGIWLRNIAKQTNMHPSTVSKYVENILAPLIEDTSLGSDEKPILRVIKLKPSVLEKLQQGMNIKQIMRIMKVIDSIQES